jgi:putative transposase
VPRSLRIAFGGVPLHVIQRGNDRKPCFTTEEDFVTYLWNLRDAALRTGCAIHAYVLMTNHVHLLLTPCDGTAASRLMQQLGRRYVRTFNARHGRTGTLFEGRFRSSVINGERYFLACQRYIERNPVRAGMVREARDYAWSSHRRYVDGREDPTLTAHECFLRLGQSALERMDAYRRLCAEELDQSVVDRLRVAIQPRHPLARAPHDSVAPGRAFLASRPQGQPG